MSAGGQPLPFSQACENNKGPILLQLQAVLADRQKVLELAGGTGQHATWFAGHMPWLRWLSTDIETNLPTLKLRCEAYTGANLLPVQALDVSQLPWPVAVPHAIFTANSLHIMPMAAVEALFGALKATAEPDTVFAVYGPFNYRGEYTSESNARFDLWLGQQHPLSAIRHFEVVDGFAQDAGFVLEQDIEMPANNRLLVWRKPGSKSA